IKAAASVGANDLPQKVFLATECSKVMKEMGLTPPSPSKTFSVMGKPFNPAQPEAYVSSFAIKRA
ncbi:MAG: hypothetical protein B7X76_04500, partial [Azorhizobium sp. 39-67-5]